MKQTPAKQREGNVFQPLLEIEGEEFLFVERQHWITLLPQFLFLHGLTAALIVFLFFISFIGHFPFDIVFSATLVILSVYFGLVSKILIDWYFHLYILTTKKVAEIAYRPLFSQMINDILIDQVRCTEIDTEIHGMLYELINIGDIIITFDRPTHQEELIFKNVSDPTALAHLIRKTFDIPKSESSQTIWYHTKHGSKPFRFTEEVFPKRQLFGSL